MTDIDYAAEALNHLDSASLHLGAEEFAFADILTKRAGVYATLALVEQQRIANLIALFNLGEPDIDDLAFDVAKALGVPRGVRKEPDND